MHKYYYFVLTATIKMFTTRIFQQPFEAYERVSGTTAKGTLFSVPSYLKGKGNEVSLPSISAIETLVKNIADKETGSSLYDLGEMIYEKQLKNYTAPNNTNILFRVKELYGAKVLHAKTQDTDEWTFITKFDCA